MELEAATSRASTKKKKLKGIHEESKVSSEPQDIRSFEIEAIQMADHIPIAQDCVGLAVPEAAEAKFEQQL